MDFSKFIKVDGDDKKTCNIEHLAESVIKNVSILRSSIMKDMKGCNIQLTDDVADFVGEEIKKNMKTGIKKINPIINAFIGQQPKSSRGKIIEKFAEIAKTMPVKESKLITTEVLVGIVLIVALFAFYSKFTDNK